MPGVDIGLPDLSNGILSFEFRGIERISGRTELLKLLDSLLIKFKTVIPARHGHLPALELLKPGTHCRPGREREWLFP